MIRQISSPTSSKQISSQRISSALLVLACLVPFVHLGAGDLVPWDESLYIIRAQSCLKFGAWLDQTLYAVGHLYSATHPPLGVWLIALSQWLFGNSTFATRLPIALLGSASIYLLWRLLRRFTSDNAALVATVSLAASDLFLTLSHRAQMEIPIHFFGIVSLYSLLLALEKDNWRYALLSGIFFGLGLLTKFGFEFFIVPAFVLMPRALEKQRFIRYPILSLLIGLAIAAPWFWMMTVRHPDYWQHVTGSINTLTAGQYAPSKLAWWYYLNRLLVAMPLIIAVFFVRWNNRMIWASIVWLVTIFIGLQIVGTRMPHFASILLLPAAFLIASCWDSFPSLPIRRRLFCVALSIAAIAWSLSEQFRLFVSHRLAWSDFSFPPEGMIIALSAIVLALLYLWFQRDRFPTNVFTILLLGFAFAHLVTEIPFEGMSGASNAARLLDSIPKSTLVLLHKDFPNEEYVPQLAYYTGGWTLGWIPRKTSRAITWDSAMTNEYLPDSSKEIAVVVRFEDRFYRSPLAETQVWNALLAKLRRHFSSERDFPSYFIFY